MRIIRPSAGFSLHQCIINLDENLLKFLKAIAIILHAVGDRTSLKKEFKIIR